MSAIRRPDPPQAGRAIRNYALVTGAYWGFTLTDGALRMLVLLHFHALGFTPVALAFLFLLYELCGVVTNLLGGWIASRMGLKVTLTGGLALQVFALVMLSLVQERWPLALSVGYVMASQALSGIAKDLTKMSAKTSVKVLVPAGEHGALFRWVAVLTGSKNALKGVGFFLGGFLLATLGFRGALWAMAGALALILVGSVASLPTELGKAKRKNERSKLETLLSKNREVNVLSGARFFLFGARDVWFVVGVPVFLSATLGWGFTRVGSFLAAWVIGYGVIQSAAPAVIRRATGGEVPGGGAARGLALLLAAVMALVAIGLRLLPGGSAPTFVVVVGLALFGAVFAINSSVHSYLILAYSEGDDVALNVGFYYMANAGGRLVGSLLSGVLFQLGGVGACLWGSVAFAVATFAVSTLLPSGHPAVRLDALGDGAGGGD